MFSRWCISAGWLALVAMGCTDFRTQRASPGSWQAPPPIIEPTLDLPTFTDSTPVVTAEVPPPPMSGGTLLVTRDGMRAVAADPDRDRVSIVDLAHHALFSTVYLAAGDEPGRLVEDDTGLVHVVLRRGGAVATIDVTSAIIAGRRTVCGAPRGIAFDEASKDLHVACADGTLATLPSAGGDVSRRVHLGADLRDVVVTPSGLVVSRFKSAELIRLTTNGDIVGTVAPLGVERVTDTPEGTTLDPVTADGAWRTIATPDGDIVMLHQYAVASSVNISPSPPSPTHPTMAATPYGAMVEAMVEPTVRVCGGIVQPAVSKLDSSGTFHSGIPIAAPILAIDAAVSPDSAWVFLAHGGQSDQGSVSFMPLTDTTPPLVGATGCASLTGAFAIEGRPVAVAFSPTVPAQEQTHTWFVVQTRAPARLIQFNDALGLEKFTIQLGGRRVVDTGHEIFHNDTGAGIACASCHLEGAEDGRVWKFDPTGDRRTQPVNIGLSGTEPFHWDGDMRDLAALVHEVFVRRMGGSEQSPERLEALGSWLDSLHPNAPIVDGSSAAAQRGKALFESTALKCTACHSGSKFTINESAFVGTTEPGHLLQVPSLLGVGYRAPFLHNGCAATLRDRFDPTCGGGEAHGNTSGLSPAEMDDLIRYLESL